MYYGIGSPDQDTGTCYSSLLGSYNTISQLEVVGKAWCLAYSIAVHVQCTVHTHVQMHKHILRPSFRYMSRRIEPVGFS